LLDQRTFWLFWLEYYCQHCFPDSYTTKHLQEWCFTVHYLCIESKI
jgi:hypothetical protein